MATNRLPAQPLVSDSPVHTSGEPLRRGTGSALRQSEALYRQLVQDLPTAIYTCDAEGRILHFNAAAVELWGRTPEIGKDQWCGSWRIFNTDGLPVPLDTCPMAITLKEGRAVRGEEIVVERPDGSRRKVLPYPAPIFDEDGAVGGAINMLVDLTESYRAEAARAEVQARFEQQSRVLQTVLSSIQDFAYVFDREGRFLFANKPLLDLWGLELEEAVGLNFHDLGYPEPLAARFQEQIEQVFRTREILTDEAEYTTPTGVGGWYEYIFAPVIGASGEVDVVAGSTRDVSERKRTEEALKDADQRKDEFLAILAHELRNPLAPIRNAVEILQHTSCDATSVKPAAEMMERQLGQMVRLIDDLLDVSRISQGKIELRRGPVELISIVHQAVEAARPYYEERRHRLEVALPREHVYLDADPTRVSQVIGNLLHNAAKFTDPGGHVWLTAESERREAVVRVKDDGIGLDAKQIREVFEMFMQADLSLERRHSGLGLGLTLVRNLVELHGGTVEAHSEGLGKGSEFIVRLPLLKETDMPRPATGAPVRRKEACPSRRILVVDDNLDSAESLALLLRLMGHDVETARDGAAGVAAAATFGAQVVFLDLGMPQLNGYDACRRMRLLPGGDRLTLIALTGWGQEEDRRRTAEAGFDAHIVKPIDPAALSSLLATLRR